MDKKTVYNKPRKQNYVLIYPGLWNIHLIKDVGMIPFTMAKSFNYNACILTYDNDNYKYLQDHLKDENFSLNFLKKRYKNQRYDVIRYLIRKSRDIDVLQFFHLNDFMNIFYYSVIYKLLNKNGKIYVKLDADDMITSILIGKRGIGKIILNFLIKYLIDCCSVETCKNYKRLINSGLNFSDKLIYLPNGLDTYLTTRKFQLTKKKNYILTVGRLGYEQKATEILLEAFSKIKDLKDWKLILIGGVEESFQNYLNTFFEKNPDLHEKVIFKGYVSDRDEICKYYSKSKVFCFTSRWESFGIALIEAAFFGNYIVSTDVGGANDILDITGYGELVKMDDPNFLGDRLQELILNWHEYEKDPQKLMNLTKKEFKWSNLCKKLYKKIN